jgi:hypothetical protein
MIEADQWAIPEPSTPAKTLESPLRHQLDLRLVAQMHVKFLKIKTATAAGGKLHLPMKYRLPSMVLEFVQVSATTMETEMMAVQCTELKKKTMLRLSDDIIQSNEKDGENRSRTG